MKPTIALFVYDPKCSVQSGNGIIKALGAFYNFKIFSINPLEDNFFDNVDMIAVPGGIGDARREIEREVVQLKKEVDSKIQKAIDNPLANK